jgi:hypothetical protein
MIRAVVIVTGRFSALLTGLNAEPPSFLRRAPRPNEMHFVVAGDSLAALMAQGRELRTVSD